MANELTLSNDFTAVRVNAKSGKQTYRGVLGVITSGNVSERAKLADCIIDQFVANNNYRHLMREVCRVFPISTIAKSPLVVVDKKMNDVYFRVDHQTLELFSQHNPTKFMAHLYAAEVLRVTADKELKGERLMYATSLRTMLDNETARLTAEIATELARIEAEASAEAGTELAL